MFGLTVFALALGCFVYYNDVNPFVFMKDYSVSLYNWYWWGFVLSQAPIFIMLIVFHATSNKENPYHRYSKKYFNALASCCIFNLLISFCFVLGSRLLIKVLSASPQNLYEFPQNQTFAMLLVFGMGILGRIAYRPKFPDRDDYREEAEKNDLNAAQTKILREALKIVK